MKKLKKNFEKHWETLWNIVKHWDIENIEQFFNMLTLKHWIRYNVNVENFNIENLLNVNVNVDFLNVSMLVSMFNVDLQTLSSYLFCSVDH